MPNRYFKVKRAKCAKKDILPPPYPYPDSQHHKDSDPQVAAMRDISPLSCLQNLKQTTRHILIQKEEEKNGTMQKK